MAELYQLGAQPRTGRARFEHGDPLCDHIYRSPNPYAQSLLWLECIHCESNIQIMFDDMGQLPRGAS